MGQKLVFFQAIYLPFIGQGCTVTCRICDPIKHPVDFAFELFDLLRESLLGRDHLIGALRPSICEHCADDLDQAGCGFHGLQQFFKLTLNHISSD
ncbi:MAG: hypothetical protein AAGF36_01560 [Pseudomonadota bacterium]